MEKHQSPDLQSILSDKSAMERMARNPDVQALARLLHQQQDTASLQKLAKDASLGKTGQLSQVMGALAESTEGAALLKRLKSQFEKH